MKYIIFILSVFLIALFIYNFDIIDILTLDHLKKQQSKLVQISQESFWSLYFVYFTIYITASALSLPGATILSIGSGAIFGFWYGLFLTSFASTIGASMAFIISRFLFRSYIKKIYPRYTKIIDKKIQEEGALYLFALRMVPALPYFVVNISMGITNIPLWKFFIVSQLGMFGASAAYVYAGTELAQINKINEILSKEIIIACIFIGILPFLANKAIILYKKKFYNYK